MIDKILEAIGLKKRQTDRRTVMLNTLRRIEETATPAERLKWNTGVKYARTPKVTVIEPGVAYNMNLTPADSFIAFDYACHSSSDSGSSDSGSSDGGSCGSD